MYSAREAEVLRGESNVTMDTQIVKECLQLSEDKKSQECIFSLWRKHDPADILNFGLQKYEKKFLLFEAI